MNQWFKLAILAFVGIIVSSVTLGVVSGFEKQPDPAAGVHGTAGGPNANHNAGTGGTHDTDPNGQGPNANGNHGTDGNVTPGYGPYGQPGPNGYPGPNGHPGPGFGPNGHPGPWGAGYGPGPWMQNYMQQNPNMQMNMQGNMQGMQDPMGGMQMDKMRGMM